MAEKHARTGENVKTSIPGNSSSNEKIRTFVKKETQPEEKIKNSPAGTETDYLVRKEKAGHLYRLRSNLVIGTADALECAKSCLEFDALRRGQKRIDLFESSIDSGATCANNSLGGKHIRDQIIREINDELRNIGIDYFDIFKTDSYL